jgi:hypothetical protein
VSCCGRWPSSTGETHCRRVRSYCPDLIYIDIFDSQKIARVSAL